MTNFDIEGCIWDFKVKLIQNFEIQNEALHTHIT